VAIVVSWYVRQCFSNGQRNRPKTVTHVGVRCRSIRASKPLQPEPSTKGPSFRHHPRTPRPASRRQPHTDTNSGPQTLESYPPQWQEAINQAKRAFRAYVAGKCGFPDPVSGVREARECLADAVEVYNEEGSALEPGTCELHCALSNLMRQVGDITREMTMLVRPRLF
jgi:hypothetical protein